MKKIFVIVMLVLATLGVQAKGRVGIAGSFNSSQLKIKDISSKNAAGFDAGVVYKQPLVLGFAIQPGLMYSNKRAGSEEARTSMSYLEIPVQVQWGIDLIAVRPFILAEPFVGYALGGRTDVNSLSVDIDPAKLNSRFEYGLGVGGGLEIVDRIQLSVKYFWNFGDCGLGGYFGSIKNAINDKSTFNGLKISLGIFF